MSVFGRSSETRRAVSDDLSVSAAVSAGSSAGCNSSRSSSRVLTWRLRPVKLVCLMPLGYAADDAMPAPMHEKYRPIEEMVKIL